MATIRPALPADLDRVCIFLSEQSVGTPARFRRMLSYTWKVQRPNLGFLMEEDSEVVGFIGAIYSERLIDGKRHKFCNLTSLAVLEPHRNQSLRMISKLLKQKDYTFTNFSPTDSVQKILSFFKFQPLDSGKTILSPVSGWRDRLRGRAGKIIYGPQNIASRLAADQRGILDDHRDYNCGHFLIERGEQSCYVLTVRRGSGVQWFADVLHASDPDLLVDSLAALHWPLLRTHGTVLVGIDSRFIREARRAVYVFERPSFFRSAVLERDQISATHSELVSRFG